MNKLCDVKEDIKEDENIHNSLSALTKEGRKKIKIQTEQDFTNLLNEIWPSLKEKLEFSASRGEYCYYYYKDFPELHRKVNYNYVRQNIYRKKIFTNFLKKKGLKLDSMYGKIYWKDNGGVLACLMCLCCEDKQIENY